jgi:hypothetical protein
MSPLLRLLLRRFSTIKRISELENLKKELESAVKSFTCYLAFCEQGQGYYFSRPLERHPNRLNRRGDSRIGVDLIQASAGLEAGRDGRSAFDGCSQTCVGRDC